PWDRVHVYWGDERCVAVDDDRSNENLARNTFLKHVPIYERHVHPIRCTDDTAASSREYEALLHRELGQRETPLDLVLLGMGDDGHTAALFPGMMALEESILWTAIVRKPGDDFDRITMTLPLLNRSRRAVFIVSGESKAETLRVILEDEGGPQWLPAARIDPSGEEALWLVDESAASLLTR
ncbi:MAG: 6-phosphogluconolactonase, partial [bacterium]|nr:6-phosphogluconolactonase [Candidatus Kapabacteria bacterium]